MPWSILSQPRVMPFFPHFASFFASFTEFCFVCCLVSGMIVLFWDKPHHLKPVLNIEVPSVCGQPGNLLRPNGASGVGGRLFVADPASRQVAHLQQPTSLGQTMLIQVQRLKTITPGLCRLKAPGRLSQTPPEGLNLFIFSPTQES